MPRRRATSMRLVPASTSISLPSMVSFGISILGGGLRPPSDAPRAQRSGLPSPRTASEGASTAPSEPPPEQDGAGTAGARSAILYGRASSPAEGLQICPEG